MEDTKSSIRSSLLAKRRSLLSAAVFKASFAIQQRVLSFPLYLIAEDVGLYMPIGNEVSTESILEHALRAKKRVCLPRIKTTDQSLEWVTVRDIKSDVSPGRLRIPEPLGKAIDQWADPAKTIILVPGVGFDATGNRIGRGTGYYDRFLSTFMDHATIVGLAYELQLVPSIPVQPGDRPVHYVITENRIIAAEEARARKAPSQSLLQFG